MQRTYPQHRASFIQYYPTNLIRNHAFTVQESQELLSSLRHMIRGMNKFAGEDD